MKKIFKVVALIVCVMMFASCGAKNGDVGSADSDKGNTTNMSSKANGDFLRNFDVIEDEDKEKIKSIEFVADIKVPKNAIKTWKLNENGKIKAWLVDDELTITQKGGVKIAPEGIKFADFRWLEKINFSSIDTSNVTSMDQMFYYCLNLKELDVSKLDTSNVTDMDLMFGGCNDLVELDVSNLDTSKVTTMEGMFAVCSKLKELDLSNFDTSNVTNMEEMFWECESLEKLNVSSFDTSNVTNMYKMFSDCSNLKELDISNFNTSNVVRMNYMFRDCKNVKGIEPNKFDLSKIY